jgi:Transposase DDE domain
MVGLSAKLFQSGMEYGDKEKRYVKFSINLKGSLPSAIRIYTDKKYCSKNPALSEVIVYADSIRGNVGVFDRGLQSRNSFDKFTDTDKMFITRNIPNIRFVNAVEREVAIAPSDATVTVIGDKSGYLFNHNEKKSKHKYRVITSRINKTDELICFVTNIMDKDAYTIAAWYRLRWEIEVFSNL